MAEFMVRVISASGISVAETLVSGETKDEVLECIMGEIESAQTGESDWAEGLEDEF